MPASVDPVYLDSSALVKLVIREAESDALRTFLIRRPLRVTSELALAELIRAVRPHGEAAVARAREILHRMYLVRLNSGLLMEAALLNPILLRTLDAIHLASAREVSATEIVTYDLRLADAAKGLGFQVAMPGSD